MFKKGLLLSIIFLLAFSISGFAAYYEYTQQSGTNFFVSAANKSDALEDTNEVRQILDDLGNLLGHSRRDGSYPKDLTTGGTLDVFDDYYDSGEIEAFDYIDSGELEAFDYIDSGELDAFDYIDSGELEAFDYIDSGELEAKDYTDSGELAAFTGQENIVTVGTIGTGTWEGTAIADGFIPDGITIDLATLATTLTITDNEDSSEVNAILFTPDGDLDGGDLGIQSDGDLTYNPSTGTLATTVLTVSGAIATATNISMTGELDMTGANAIIDLNPAQTGTVQIMNITPSAVLTANEAEWDGILINGNTLQPSGDDILVHGIHLDFSTFSPTGAGVHVDGFKVEMPDLTEHGLCIIDGKIIIQGDIPPTAIAQFTGIDFIYSVDSMESTSMLHAIDVAVAEGSPDGDVVAVGTHTYVDVIHQHIGTFYTPDQADSDSYAGIDDGGIYTAGLDTVEMFVANGDGFWIGDSAKFDELEVDMSSDATRSVEPTFWYWKNTPAWTQFYPADDTEGFQHSGLVRWASGDLTDWLSADPASDSGETGYWIRVLRTATADPGTPTASTIKTGAITLYEWDKSGDLTVKDIDANDINAASLVLDTALAIAEGGTGVSTGAMTNFTSILNTVLYVGRDADNKISWDSDDRIKIKIGGTEHSIASISDGAGDNDILVTKGYVDDEISGVPGGGDMLKATYDADADDDIDVAAGGTEKSSWTQYAIPYLSNTTVFDEIPIGTAGYALTTDSAETGYDWTLLSEVVVDSTTLADGEYQAVRLENWAVGETVVYGQLVYFNWADKEWKLADAADSTEVPALGIALESKNNGETCKILREGYIRDDDWNFTSWMVYLSDSPAGGVLSAPPSDSGDQVQRVGDAVSADIMYFNPSIDVGEI